MKHVTLILVLITACSSFTFGIPPEDARALLERVDNNFAPFQFESLITIKNYKPGNSMTTQKAHIWRKGEMTLVVMSSPAIQKGQAIIRNKDDMWMYLPNSGKVLRIGGKEQSIGSEASNSDLLRVDLSKDYTAANIGEDTIDGIPCYKLELLAKDRTVAYDKIIYWVDREKELPVKREYYALSGKHLKTMFFRDVRLFHGRLRPAFILIQNEQNQNYKTEVIFEDLFEVSNLGDFIFTPAYVKQGTLQ